MRPRPKLASRLAAAAKLTNDGDGLFILIFDFVNDEGAALPEDWVAGKGGKAKTENVLNALSSETLMTETVARLTSLLECGAAVNIPGRPS